MSKYSSTSALAGYESDASDDEVISDHLSMFDGSEKSIQNLIPWLMRVEDSFSDFVDKARAKHEKEARSERRSLVADWVDADTPMKRSEWMKIRLSHLKDVPIDHLLDIELNFPRSVKAWDLFAKLKEAMMDLYYADAHKLVLEKLSLMKQQVRLVPHRAMFLFLYGCLSQKDREAFPQGTLARLFRKSLTPDYAVVAATILDLESIRNFPKDPVLDSELPIILPAPSQRRPKRSRKARRVSFSEEGNERKRRNDYSSSDASDTGNDRVETDDPSDIPSRSLYKLEKKKVTNSHDNSAGHVVDETAESSEDSSASPPLE